MREVILNGSRIVVIARELVSRTMSQHVHMSWTPPAAERPRSSSITSISDQPNVLSPRFWSPGRSDTLESAASDAVERLFRTSRKSAPSITSADKSVWGSTARRTLAQATDQTSTLESPANGSRRMQSGRSQRQHRPASQLPHECRSAGRTMDATDTAVPETWYCGRSQALLYNAIRPHASIGYKPPAPDVFVPTFAARGQLRYADRLHRPRWRIRQP